MAGSAGFMLDSGTSLHGKDIYKSHGIGVDKTEGYSPPPQPLPLLVSRGQLNYPGDAKLLQETKPFRCMPLIIPNSKPRYECTIPYPLSSLNNPPSRGTSSLAISSSHGAAAALCSLPIVSFLHSTTLACSSSLAAYVLPSWSVQLCLVPAEDLRTQRPHLSSRIGLQI